MNYVSYRYSLYKLNLKIRKFEKDSLKDIENAKKRNDKEQQQVIENLLVRNDIVFDNDKHTLITKYLISECERRCLPIPERDHDSEYWEGIQGTDDYHNIYLSKKGIAELRELLKKDSKERFESIARWVTIIIGLIGAITGLVAVWKS